MILKKNKDFFVEAVIEATENSDNNNEIVKPIPIADFELPQEAINYVINFQQTLIIPNAIDSIYSEDIYIDRHKCKSIVCLPINFKNKFIGIVYLENNLKPNAFPIFKLEILKILISQVAIAIRNARLFASEEEKTRILKFRSEIDSTIAKSNNLQQMLQRCTEIIVSYLGVAFARIWTHNPQEKLLYLQSSAGMYTHTDGSHSRIPVGKFKIGLIAQEGKPHITNSVQTDERVSNKQWAIYEKMVAFAGYPLIADSELMGVVAMFSKQQLNQNTINTLSFIAGEIAVAPRLSICVCKFYRKH